MSAGVDGYLQRKHRGQFSEEGLELVADGGPQVAGGVHGEGLHEGSDVVQAVQHSASCWQTLLVVQPLQGGGRAQRQKSTTALYNGIL